MGKYILITGGELKNKGAQAMTFITVDEMKKRYPDKEVILLSDIDCKRPKEVKDNYRFTILPFPRKVIILQSKFLSFFYRKFKKDSNFNRFCDILSDSDALIDVSGYTYGSNWGTRHTFYFLLRIKMANAWKVPVYLMPQSFGPFDFKGKHAPFVRFLSKHEMKKAKAVMAREQEGMDGLKKNYKLKNVILTPDLVLQNKGINIDNIYKTIPEMFNLDIPDNSVAVIPNSKNIKYSSEDTAYGMYKILVEKLLEKKKRVYLIHHATEDFAVCKKIKDQFFANDDRVNYIEYELSCIEFEDLVKKFDFVVASRYHSIVHSYKMAVPAIILGWSIKYAELSGKFEQSRFCFDIKDTSDKENMLKQVEYMCDNFATESEKIKSGLYAIQDGNVYDYVDLKGRES